MTEVWDWIKSINETKTNLLLEGEDIRAYVPYVVNKSLSYHLDSIMFSNEMNRLFHIPAECQYQFYLNSLKKNKRYSKWVKPQNIQDLEIIKKYYDINNTKAMEVLDLLSKKQIEYIKNKLETCGLKK